MNDLLNDFIIDNIHDSIYFIYYTYAMNNDEFMQKNFPWFWYASLQLWDPSVLKNKEMTTISQQRVQDNFLVFDWEKFSKPKNNLETPQNDGIKSWNHESYTTNLAKLFDSL